MQQSTTEIESKRLSYFLKSLRWHMLFFTQQRTQHFPKLLLGITTKVAFLDVTLLASLKIVYTGNFLELKTLAEKCIGCDERDSVVTLFLYQTIKSLSVCTWKKLQKTLKYVHKLSGSCIIHMKTFLFLPVICCEKKASNGKKMRLYVYKNCKMDKTRNEKCAQ